MMILRFLTTALLLMPIVIMAESALINKSDNLREKPFIDSKAIMLLKKGQTVDIQKREGSWYLLKVRTITGWAPMLSVHRSQPSTVKTGTLSQVSTGRSSTGGVVSTTGVRGLNEENLKTATFSEETVARSEKFRVTSTGIVAFVSEGGLVKQDIPTLKNQTTVKGTK